MLENVATKLNEPFQNYKTSENTDIVSKSNTSEPEINEEQHNSEVVKDDNDNSIVENDVENDVEE